MLTCTLCCLLVLTTASLVMAQEDEAEPRESMWLTTALVYAIDMPPQELHDATVAAIERAGYQLVRGETDSDEDDGNDEDAEDAEDDLQPLATVVLAPTQRFPPPPVAQGPYTTQGITQAELTRMHRQPHMVFVILVDVRPGLEHLAAQDQLIAEILDGRSAAVWMEPNRLAYGAPRFQTIANAWQGAVPDIRQSIHYHWYQTEAGYYRIVTLGMERLHLPNLCIDHMTDANARDALRVVHLVAQQLAEGMEPSEQVTVNLAVQHPGMAAALRQRRSDEAPGQVALRLTPATPHPGDPEGPLLRITADPATGDPAAQVQAIIDALFGPSDGISMVHNEDAAVEAAHQEAVRQFFADIQPRYQAGLPEGARLFVKVGFDSPQGAEYMWVHVTAWNGGTIHGVLDSDPRFVQNLRAGQTVHVPATDVYDYLLVLPDGTIEGNLTGQAIERSRQAAGP